LAGHTKMAATGFTPISLYYTTTASAAPTAGNLVAGELAINTNDGVLYYKDSSGVVQSIASKAGNSGSFTNLAYTGTLTGGTGIVNLGSGQFYKTAAGNIGVGTTTPLSLGGATLQVENSTIGAIIWSDGTRIGELLASSAANVSVGARSNHALQLVTNDTERMRIDTSGNVGIGTSSAGVKLDVTGTIRASQSLVFGSNGTTGAGSIYSDSNWGCLITAKQTSPALADFMWQSASSVERMRIDSSGNVGIGTSSPTLALSVGVNAGVNGINHIYTGTGGPLNLATWTSNVNTGEVRFGGVLAGYFPTFYSSNTERMRISSDGRLYLNQTVGNGNTPQRMGMQYDGSVEWGLSFQNLWSGNAGSAVNFNNYSGTQVGTIQAGASSTSYVTTSDYRLKENVLPMAGALAKVSQLKPCTYTWKETGETSEGFIAHELQEVCPDAVTGKKDGTRTVKYEISPAIPAEIDEDGKVIKEAIEAVMGEKEVPDYQGIDTSFLVATLTAAIQEQQAMIEELKAKVAALEAA